jgi:uncharacterized membrane protein YfcA
MISVPDLALWQWAFGLFGALMIGTAKTGAPGVGTLIVPLMVMVVGDARYAAAWTAPILSTGDIFAVVYWRRHADARKLFSLIPWVVAGMAAGAFALGLTEMVLRRTIGIIVLAMLALNLRQRYYPGVRVANAAAFYGIAAGFATTIANAAGPVMNMYLLSRRLSKEQFVATGAWFFFVVNLAKVPIYLWYGLFSAQSLVFDLLMVPAVICGAFMGLWLIRKIPQSLFDTLIFLLTAISSIFLFR